MRSWDQHRRAKPVELGDEAPLIVGDADPSRYTRRGVSIRWLVGAVTTAVTSVALMGGALVAALDGRYVVNAEAAVLSREVVDAPRAQKGDRVTPVYEEVSSRRMIEISTIVRQGEQDLIQKRPYAVINASLVLDKKEIGDVPAFDARKLQQRDDTSEEGATDAIYDKAVDGEITVSVSSFPLEQPVVFDDAVTLDEDEIERQLRDEQYIDNMPMQMPLGDAAGFIDDTSGTPANVTIVPENVSELVKRNEDDETAGSGDEFIELVQPGDTLQKILLGSGVGEADVDAINDILSRLGVAKLRAGQTLRIAFRLEETDEGAARRPSRFSIYKDSRHVATVAMTDTGEFVLGEAPPGPAPKVEDAQVATSKSNTPSVYKSLYQTAVNHELPESVRDTLLATFSLDLDFNSQVRPGDKLTVIHSQKGGDSEEILYAALTAGSVERRFYRFKAPDGTVDFYDEDGRTGDKFLMRKPMSRGVFRSGFGQRRHPILRRTRMHNGVDYAAPRGTPIYAAGDGVVKQAGWKAGYGRWVSIRHANGYETGYAHQSRIAKGIKPGVTVKQGQVIGYVGTTGLSTGPHLHFEVKVNGRHVNPLKIRLRRGRELSGAQLATFQAERERIDNILSEEFPVASR
ncbi:M23 family metallopeptidase [Acuticoccus sp. MNP-M23]|uniref:M23 family metallopeptidase n=1 Tax=Acuticoccus sp. MNP-M23 TaxID=3072793 RepID=UPI002814D688|nr:M23 family metallopeptidase [Acuticoccus sp. MNP-M23]WMS42827.1 M23 family metallopeptidase [Acuticoccus sp. MNP-M23]